MRSTPRHRTTTCCLSRIAVGALCLLAALAEHASAQSAAPSKATEPEKVIIDTDIGDDVDDAFAVGLALQSAELKIVGITSAWGNTTLRVKLLRRLLEEVGHTDIPVALGIERHHSGEAAFSQARWAEAGPPLSNAPDAVDFLLQKARTNPGQITLIAIAPLTNVGAAIDRDPAMFRKLKRVVIMGGSVDHGYDDLGQVKDKPPVPEYNIAMDPHAAQKLFTSGVPLYVMPLDSTQLPLDELRRTLIFTQGTPLTDALTLLYHQWSRTTHRQTPTMFDPMAVAYVIDPNLCPAQPLRLRVDDQGYTRREPGEPNVNACLDSDPTKFFAFFIPRVLKSVAISRGKPAATKEAMHSRCLFLSGGLH
jgi:inosine-uridine nucleoside N-ribohydrolase